MYGKSIYLMLTIDVLTLIVFFGTLQDLFLLNKEHRNSKMFNG